MTKFDCGCRIMTDVTTLNGRNQPNWNYLLKTFVNVCGKCYKKQMKFQYMENKLMVMEKQRMDMFFGKWRWRGRHILWPDRVEGTSQNPPTQWKTQSEGFWEVKKPRQWTRPQWRNEWNWYGYKGTGRGGKGKQKLTRFRKLNEPPKTT